MKQIKNDLEKKNRKIQRKRVKYRYPDRCRNRSSGDWRYQPMLCPLSLGKLWSHTVTMSPRASWVLLAWLSALVIG